MKIALLLILIRLMVFQHVDAQVVKDPLLAYFQTFDNSSQLSSKIEIRSFEADFTGNGKKSIFITNELARLGPHGNYGWSVYVPVDSGGYLVVENGLDAGIDGPHYIGYIEQIKKYGAITAIGGGKYGITAQYLENGAIQSQAIDEKRGQANAEHYPKYFTAKFPDYGIIKYTLEKLQRKYASPDSTNVITPVAR